MNPRAPFNLDQALAKLDGDLETLREIAAIFLKTQSADLTAIGEALERRDAHALRLTAHRFKSAVANFFATRTADAALQLELMGREEKFDQAAEAWHELQDAMRELLPPLERFAAVPSEPAD